jgi:hypothetical protein
MVMKDILEILNESFDRKLTNEERQYLEKTLYESEKLREEKKMIEKTRKIMSNYNPAFSSSFSKKLLEKIDDIKISDNVIDLYPVFKKILIGGIAATLALLLSVYLADGTINADSIFGVKDIASDELLLSLANF